VQHGLVLPLAGAVLMIVCTATLCLVSMGRVKRADSQPSGWPPGVNPAALCAAYGVDQIASEQDRQRQPGQSWQELDRLRLNSGGAPVAVYSPLGPTSELTPELRDELRRWQQALRAWRTQDWDACDVHLLNLQRQNAKKVLYRLYADRVASRRRLPPDPAWDGAISIESLQAPPSRTGSTGHTMSKSP